MKRMMKILKKEQKNAVKLMSKLALSILSVVGINVSEKGGLLVPCTVTSTHLPGFIRTACPDNSHMNRSHNNFLSNKEKKMYNRFFNSFLIVVVALFLQGCATGYNHSLVKNSANVGFDLDSQPGKLEAAISSNTGGMTPTFEGGQTLPLLANVSSKTGGLGQFINGSSSTVITGDAAYTMSYLYADCNQKVAPVKAIPDVKLTKKPKAVPGPGEVKPAVFMTSGMLGANFSFGREAPVAPTAAKLGFNRYEAVVAPITITSDNPTDYTAGTPSMIATLDHESDLRNKTNTNGDALKYSQHFSTGSAADNLALRSDIRRNALQRINPYMQDSFCEDNFETKIR